MLMVLAVAYGFGFGMVIAIWRMASERCGHEVLEMLSSATSSDAIPETILLDAPGTAPTESANLSPPPRSEQAPGSGVSPRLSGSWDSTGSSSLQPA